MAQGGQHEALKVQCKVQALKCKRLADEHIGPAAGGRCGGETEDTESAESHARLSSATEAACHKLAIPPPLLVLLLVCSSLRITGSTNPRRVSPHSGFCRRFVVSTCRPPVALFLPPPHSYRRAFVAFLSLAISVVLTDPTAPRFVSSQACFAFVFVPRLPRF